MKVTMKDLAEYCGVSLTTVSYCLNGNKEIPEKTRRKILAAAQELNYVPNAQARGLKSKKTFNIGVFIPDFDGPIHHQILSSISYQLKNENSLYHMIVTMADDSFALIRGCSVDLAIIMDSRVSPELIKELSEFVPIICFDINVIHNNVYNVNIDNLNGMCNQVVDLIKSGSKKIGYILGSSTSSHNKERYEGYLKALNDSNIKINESIIYNADSFVESVGYDTVKKIINDKIDFDTLVCSNDELAIGAIRALQEHNINVPRDIKVAGFDNIDKGRLISPNLSTVSVDWNECGKKIASFALKILNPKKQKIDESITIYTKIIKRESTL